MKIFYIDPQSYHNLSLYDKNLLQHYDNQDVTFFGNILWDTELLANVKTNLCFKYSNKKNILNKIFSYISSILEIVKQVNILSPDIVHIQWTRILAVDIMFLFFLKRKNIKVVYTAHNVIPHNSNIRKTRLLKRYYHIVDKIIVHSKYTKEELIQLFDIQSSKISVIPHGPLDLPGNQIDLFNRINYLKQHYNLSDKIIISSLGVQSRYKGVDILIQVWEKYFNNRSDVKLILAGKNDNIDYSSILHLDNIIIIDKKIPNLDFKALINLSDIIVLPYRKISQSGVLFSAMEQNTPVIISNVGGLTEPLQYGNIGWCIGEPNITNLHNILSELLNNKFLIQSIKNNNYEFEKVRQNYSWEKISKNTIDLYKTLVHTT